jgi:hypothetical protein
VPCVHYVADSLCHQMPQDKTCVAESACNLIHMCIPPGNSYIMYRPKVRIHCESKTCNKTCEQQHTISENQKRQQHQTTKPKQQRGTQAGDQQSCRILSPEKSEPNIRTSMAAWGIQSPEKSEPKIRTSMAAWEIQSQEKSEPKIRTSMAAWGAMPNKK